MGYQKSEKIPKQERTKTNMFYQKDNLGPVVPCGYGVPMRIAIKKASSGTMFVGLYPFCVDIFTHFIYIMYYIYLMCRECRSSVF